MTLREDIEVQQGVTWQRVYALTGIESIDGFTAQMQIRETVGSATTLADWSTAGGEIEVDDTNMQIVVTVDAADTRARCRTSRAHSSRACCGPRSTTWTTGASRPPPPSLAPATTRLST